MQCPYKGNDGRESAIELKRVGQRKQRPLYTPVNAGEIEREREKK
jgi:hypothetical protein